MEFEINPEDRAKIKLDCLNFVSKQYDEMVEFVARSPLILEDANILLSSLTSLLVRLFLLLHFFLFFLILFHLV